VRDVEVKINREIRDFTESIFFGLSLRQFAFSAFACAAAVGIFFLLRPYLSIETLSWLCIVAAAPFAAIGFVTYHSMTAEQFVWAWTKSELLTPRRLVYVPENTYLALLCAKPAKEKKKRGATRRDKDTEKPASTG
jgi:hypothetical protein